MQNALTAGRKSGNIIKATRSFATNMGFVSDVAKTKSRLVRNIAADVSKRSRDTTRGTRQSETPRRRLKDATIS